MRYIWSKSLHILNYSKFSIEETVLETNPESLCNIDSSKNISIIQKATNIACTCFLLMVSKFNYFQTGFP